MKLHFIKSKKFKTTVVCLLIKQELCRENATINALIPNYLQRGSKKYDLLSKVNSVLEEMYGCIFGSQIVKKGEQQLIQFYLEFLTDNKKLRVQALEFLKDIITNPIIEESDSGVGFKESYFEIEKTNLKLAIESRINNKAEYTKLKCLENMCADEKFGIYGDGYVEDIEKITPQSAYKHYQGLLSNAPIDFFILSNEKEEELKEEVEKLFEFANSNLTEIEKSTTDFEKKELKRIVEDCDMTQGKICMGFRTGIENVGDEFYRLMVLNETLGGGSNSLLFANVREKESLCYYINSFIYRFKGIVFIQSGVDSKNFERVIELTNEQIEFLKNDKLSDEVFSNAKKGLIKKFKSIDDAQMNLIDFNVSQKMLGDSDSIVNCIERINKVKKEELPPIAEKLHFDTVFMLQANKGEANGQR